MKRLSAVISGLAFVSLLMLTPAHAGAKKNEFGLDTYDPDPHKHEINMMVTQCARIAGVLPGTNITLQQMRIVTACIDNMRPDIKSKR